MFRARSIVPTVAIVWLTSIQPGQSLPADKVAEISKAVTIAIKTDNSIGSGVIIKKTGQVYTVLTAAHVLRNANATYKITTIDDRQYPLNYQTVKVLPGADLAILQFTSSQNYQVVKVGNSNKVVEGVPVYVGGFPLNTAAINKSIFNFTDGRVTANSSKPLSAGYSIIYTNVTLPGMSGGSVLNEQGELVAIHGKGDVDTSTSASSINPNIRIKTGFNLGISANTFVPLASKAGVQLEVAAGGSVTPRASSDDDLLVTIAVKVQNADYQGALTDLDRLIATNPKKATAYYLRANINQQLGNKDRVLEDLDRAIKLDPKNSQAYLSRANILHDKLDTSGALEDLNKVINLDPKNIQAYELRAVVYSERGDFDSALTDYNRLVQLNPQNPNSYLMRASIYLSRQDYKNALDNYNSIIQLTPKDYRAYQGRASIYQSQGNLVDSLVEYDKIIKIKPEDPLNYSMRANIKLQMKDFPGAIADCDTIIKIFRQRNNTQGYETTMKTIDMLQKLNPSR
jgi:Tfp pilus assembly protein PilF/V8-like Glu-specific endopeptidase